MQLAPPRDLAQLVRVLRGQVVPPVGVKVVPVVVEVDRAGLGDGAQRNFGAIRRAQLTGQCHVQVGAQFARQHRPRYDPVTTPPRGMASSSGRRRGRPLNASASCLAASVRS